MDTNKKLFLLDAYALIYRAYYALIRNPRVNSKGQNTSAIMGFVNTLEEVLTKENPTHIGVAFDPSGPTFRHEAYPKYKAQREATPEDIKWSVPYIKEIIKAYNIPILEVQRYEADDVIGTISKQAASKGFDVYMMTPDKDYGQLVDKHVFMYRPKHTGGFEVFGIDQIKEKYGVDNTSQIIDLLGLMGDASDNIPGCPGVGEKTAQKLIEQFGSIEKLLENTNELKGALKKKVEENKEQIIFSEFLATIKTDVPISFDAKQLERKNVDIMRLAPIFEELEFRTILKRFKDKYQGYEEQPQPVEQTAQLSLFASPEPENKSKNSVQLQGELFFEDSQSIKNISKKYYIIDILNDKENILRKIFTSDIVAIEPFSTSNEPMEAKLLGIALSNKNHEAYFISFSKEHREEGLKVLKNVITDSKSTIVSNDIKNLIILLKRNGIELQAPLFDTAIAHYLIQPELRHSTEFLADIYLQYKVIPWSEINLAKEEKEKKKKIKPEEFTAEELLNYICERADISYQLYNILEKEMKDNKVTELFTTIEMPLTPVLATMEENGMKIDTLALEQTSNEFTERLNEIEREIHIMADEEFNVASPKQVGEILFDKLKISEKAKKTKTGQYVTSEEVLESYRSKHPIIGEILKYRGLKKLLSTYVDALPKLINKDTGRIHTSFNQTVTATGRLSSSNPNLQNIPIRDEDGREIRKAFIPDEGCEFFSADYSQIELRIMAHLSQDENMIHAFLSGEDIHAATAAKIYNVSIDEVTADMRRKAKTANFGIIYGISVFGLAERLNISRQEAKELIDGYFKTYPKIKEYMDLSIEIAQKQGYVETIFHRKRYLSDINSKNSVVRGYAERNAINAPIQGSAADIIKVAMVGIAKQLNSRNMKSKMILQVHDELNFSVPKEEKEMLQLLIIQEMENACKLSVPLKADCGWGKNWLEAH